MTATLQPLVLHRIYQARPLALYEAWIDPDQRMAWMVPPEFRMVECSSDGRVGGCWTLTLADASGAIHRDTGRYLALDPGVLIETTWQYEGSGRVEPSDSHLVVEFRPLNPDTTELILTHSRLEPGEVTEDYRVGWLGNLDRLGGLLQPA